MTSARSADHSPDRTTLSTRIDTDTGNTADGVAVVWWLGGESSTEVLRVEFVDGGGITVNGSQLQADWATGTRYDVTVDWDWANDQADVTINGTSLNVAFQNAASAVDTVEWENDCSNSGTARTCYLDSVMADVPTSGSVTVAFDPAGTAPDDVFAWDTAVFTRSLDGETVDVYLEEAAGSPGWTKIAGPIQRGDSIPADPANDVRFRIDLSRSSLSADPTLDSLARRWVL